MHNSMNSLDYLFPDEVQIPKMFTEMKKDYHEQIKNSPYTKKAARLRKLHAVYNYTKAGIYLGILFVTIIFLYKYLFGC